MWGTPKHVAVTIYIWWINIVHFVGVIRELFNNMRMHGMAYFKIIDFICSIHDAQRAVTHKSTIGVLFVNYRDATFFWNTELVTAWESQNVATFTEKIFWSATKSLLSTADIIMTSHHMRRVSRVTSGCGCALCRYLERPNFIEGT